ncbi:MAG: ribbon-helix-helix domain-containing protein [Xenococcaceae cyanobacterium MO_207.B15]|nr:ribbon-helix-helix domain-containing protein [Xenococcaceae cyanobacterium MO_207.B15]
MATKSINITIDEKLLTKLDSVVASRRYANRSRMIEEAVLEKLLTLDEELIGEQAKLLSCSESEEWLEGELELWQEE